MVLNNKVCVSWNFGKTTNLLGENFLVIFEIDKSSPCLINSLEVDVPLEISKYIRDLLEEGSIEKTISKLKKELFNSFELLKEMRDSVKIGKLSFEDFQARKSKIEKRIEEYSSRILYLKQAREQIPLIEEGVQKEAELLLNEYQLEKIVMLMINAIGMVERRELEVRNRLEILEDDMNLIKSFLLSKPTPIQESARPSSRLAPSPRTRPIPAPSTALPAAGPSLARPFPQSSPDSGPSEEDIVAFRRKLLKPTPKDDKPKPEPISIRSALLQEIKEFFGTAKKEVAVEKERGVIEKKKVEKEEVELEKEKGELEKEEVEPEIQEVELEIAEVDEEKKESD